MNVIEKKKIIHKIIDKIPEENLEEVIFYLQKLSNKDQNRISIVEKLLKDEQWLFEELAK